MSARDQQRLGQSNDVGFTLVELVIAVALMAVLTTVISGALIVTLRSSPQAADRADAAVNVQGLVTWLPQDVDSTKPGGFETAQGLASGCGGTDPGFNVLKLSWSEQISSTKNFVASYRYVARADGGKIVRVYCEIGKTPSTLNVSGLIPPWVTGNEPVRITLRDSSAGPSDPFDATKVDALKFEIEPIVGKTIVIDAATKNPNETLTTTPPTTTPATPTTTAPNQAPVAVDVAATINSSTPVVINLSASDPDSDPLTVTLAAVPVGWTVTMGAGLTLDVIAPVTAEGTTETISYTVDDGTDTATANVVVTVTAPSSNQPPVANPVAASTDPNVLVVVALAASDPEGGALTASFAGVPVGWTVAAAGLDVSVTPDPAAVIGDYLINYTVTDAAGATAGSTITITVTGPPPCIITGPTLSRTSVDLKKNNPDSLKNTVDVSITIVSGYCVGLALHYDTGAANGQYVRNFGPSGTTRTVTLPKHPSPELWLAGNHALDVKDSTTLVLGSANLEVET